MEYADKVVLVAGARGTIGKAVAQAFQGAGAKVIPLLHNIHDVSNYFDMQRLGWSLSHLDILVNCAAAPNLAKPSVDINIDEWERIIATDVTGAFYLSQLAGRLMLPRKWGRIIQLTSFHTLVTYPERVAYATAKHAVLGMVKALALEWGPHGITVNAVAPGPVDSQRIRERVVKEPEAMDGMLSRTPTKRLCTAEEVAQAVLYLASNGACHVNGAQLMLDGGWSVNGAW